MTRPPDRAVRRGAGSKVAAVNLAPGYQPAAPAGTFEELEARWEYVLAALNRLPNPGAAAEVFFTEALRGWTVTRSGPVIQVHGPGTFHARVTFDTTGSRWQDKVGRNGGSVLFDLPANTATDFDPADLDRLVAWASTARRLDVLRLQALTTGDLNLLREGIALAVNEVRLEAVAADARKVAVRAAEVTILCEWRLAQLLPKVGTGQGGNQQPGAERPARQPLTKGERHRLRALGAVPLEELAAVLDQHRRLGVPVTRARVIRGLPPEPDDTTPVTDTGDGGVRPTPPKRCPAPPDAGTDSAEPPRQPDPAKPAPGPWPLDVPDSTPEERVIVPDGPGRAIPPRDMRRDAPDSVLKVPEWPDGPGPRERFEGGRYKEDPRTEPVPGVVAFPCWPSDLPATLRTVESEGFTVVTVRWVDITYRRIAWAVPADALAFVIATRPGVTVPVPWATTIRVPFPDTFEDLVHRAARAARAELVGPLPAVSVPADW